MRKSYLYYKLAFVAMLAVAVQGCRKENGIDNNNVIKKPYGLYIGDDQGQLLNTNDGDSYKTIFPPDGFPSRALVTSGENIIWVKGNVHLSQDNGKNFNPTYGLVQSFYLNLTPYIPWQQIIINAADQDRVYLGSVEGKGIVYSDDHGKTWTIDNDWDDFLTGGGITSFAQLSNGSLFAHGLQFDSLYKRDNKSDKWTWISPQTPLPSLGIFYISSYNNTLVATDISGQSGAYYSDDDGKNWTAYTGLPNTHLLYTTNAPFGETLLVGTDSMGVYRLQNGQFVAANNGLETNTVVYGIIGKDNIYKNDVTKKFVYLATNKGLYRSDDMGQNWSLVKPGSYVSLY